jgi:hypothetical protein
MTITPEPSVDNLTHTFHTLLLRNQISQPTDFAISEIHTSDRLQCSAFRQFQLHLGQQAGFLFLLTLSVAFLGIQI